MNPQEKIDRACLYVMNYLEAIREGKILLLSLEQRFDPETCALTKITLNIDTSPSRVPIGVDRLAQRRIVASALQELSTDPGHLRAELEIEAKEIDLT